MIDEILYKDIVCMKTFLGTFAKNELPKKLKFPCCFIVNTHPRKNEGEHWLAFYFDRKSKFVRKITSILWF